MVLYFSGTGNSRYVAKKIAEISGDEIISINQRLKAQDYSPVSSEKPLVFVGPVYAGRLPRIMDDYIRKVSFTGTKHAYFIGTCAQTPWVTVEYVEKLCKEKGFTLLGFHSVVMPQGYIAGGGTQPKEVNDRILKEAEPKILELAETIRDQQTLPKEQPGKAIMSKVLNPIMYAMMISAKGFAATEKCTGCGKCEARCPLNNVKLADGKPTWGKNCTHCMACIAGCPAEAIEYGKKTQGKTRYYLGDE
ncbi:MAG: EFR1 family ferrodoxin [Lachnospiraceae bacterium]|nr:EFR1 family ferrodoxin [Lachnospiraceae bacterium]